MNHNKNIKSKNYPTRPTGEAKPKPMPYRFDEVRPEQATIDLPMWRDGQAAEERFSGELLLSLEALTPLFVGNHQKKLDEKHSLLMPQMLADGRVLIGASSLKGMLRATLASLLDAPMERVTEHHYTYRPNFGFGTQKEAHPAIVEKVRGSGSESKITIKLLPKDSSVVFVRDEAGRKIRLCDIGGLLDKEVADIKITGNSPHQRLEYERGQRQRLSHYLYSYAGGIDGKGILAKAFSARNRVYHHVLVERNRVDQAQSIHIPDEVYRTYLETQKVLADEHLGHMAPGHPLKAKIEEYSSLKDAIKEHAPLREGQLIYVEIENGQTPEVTSMGHHFHYRWAYTSSVRYKNRVLDGQGMLRQELAPHHEEICDEHGAPKKLSAVRLLFGYALDGRDEALEKLAKGSYKRLAGRVTFNHAVEVRGEKTMAERFIKGGDELTLRVLGMPRPSAIEFYLKQPYLPNSLTTYGDLPRDAGGDLAGRKNYRHQPDAAKDENVYAANSFGQNRHLHGEAEERGSRVRFVSKPGSRFLCTLRFDSLRLWELGAVLAALEPKRLAAQFGLCPAEYAHKLGYAKPLGLGSVKFNLDGARWQRNDDWLWQESNADTTQWKTLQKNALVAFKTKLSNSWENNQINVRNKIQAWLKARVWSNQGLAAYPVAPDKDGNPTIYQFHTKLRQGHAKQRRGGNADFSKLKTLLGNN